MLLANMLFSQDSTVFAIGISGGASTSLVSKKSVNSEYIKGSETYRLHYGLNFYFRKNLGTYWKISVGASISSFGERTSTFPALSNSPINYDRKHEIRLYNFGVPLLFSRKFDIPIYLQLGIIPYGNLSGKITTVIDESSKFMYSKYREGRFGCFGKIGVGHELLFTNNKLNLLTFIQYDAVPDKDFTYITDYIPSRRHMIIGIEAFYSF